MKRCANCGRYIKQRKKGRPREYCNWKACKLERKARVMRLLYWRNRYGEEIGEYARGC